MVLISDAAQSAYIAMSYGPDRHSTLSLAQLEVALYAGHPLAGGVEMDASGGYAAALVDNDGTTWPDPPDAGTLTSFPVPFPDSTGPWLSGGDEAVITHWVIRDPDTGDLWDCAPLPGDGLTIQEAGVTGITIQLVVGYADATIS